MRNPLHRPPWHRAPIVLVEDDPNDAFFVRHALEAARITNPVIAYQSADEARRELGDMLSVGPALFILDLFLESGDSGLDFLRWLRSQSVPLGSTPAMLLTASDLPDHRRESTDLGALFYLQKPITEARLTEAVQTLGLVVVKTSLVPGETGFRIIERS